MTDLSTCLYQAGYQAVAIELTETQHFTVRAIINKKEALFVVDCGASHSCLDRKVAEEMGLHLNDSLDKASGLGSNTMDKSETLIEQFRIEMCYFDNVSFAVLDLTNINEALQVCGQSPIDGIIGNDILLKSNAVIDFKRALLYIKQP